MCSSEGNVRLVTLSAAKLSLAPRVTPAFVPSCPAQVPGPRMNKIKAFSSVLKWRNEKHQIIYVVSVPGTVIKELSRHDDGDSAGDIVIL